MIRTRFHFPAGMPRPPSRSPWRSPGKERASVRSRSFSPPPSASPAPTWARGPGRRAAPPRASMRSKLHRQLGILVQVDVQRVQLRIDLIEAVDRRGGGEGSEEDQHAQQHTLPAALTRPIHRGQGERVLILATLLLALPHRVYVSNEASDDVSVIENDAVVA